jgi:hypothetical protein
MSFRKTVTIKNFQKLTNTVCGVGEKSNLRNLATVKKNLKLLIGLMGTKKQTVSMIRVTTDFALGNSLETLHQDSQHHHDNDNDDLL